MEPAGHWANPTYIADNIDLILIPNKANSSVFVQKYEIEKKTTQQIADQLGVSRQMVGERLKDAQVTINRGRYNSKDNYRLANPPYGFKIFRTKLVENRDETKIAKIVVRMRRNEKSTWLNIATALNELGHHTRKKTQWTLFGVRAVFNHWKDKL